MGAAPRIDRARMAADSRERLLATAIELFARHGYAGTSVSVLCREVGVAPTVLYWHFGSKAGLLAAAVERAASSWIEQIRKSCYAADAVEDRLDLLIQGLRTLISGQVDEFSLLMSCYLQRPGDDPELEEIVDRIHASSVEHLVRGIEDALHVRIPNLDLVAEMTLGYVDMVALTYRREGSTEQMDRRLAHLKDMIALGTLHALRKSEANAEEQR